MLARFRTGAKFFTIGLLVGVLCAPDSGERFRERIIEMIRAYIPGSRNGE